MKKLTAFLLTMVLSVNLISCGKNDLMLDIEPQKVTVSAEKVDEGQLAAADFAVRLFQQCVSDEENILISPISVMAALSMTANGAEGETLSQMEAVLGADTAALNDFMHDYLANTGDQLKMADGIWFKDDFDVSKDFLQTNADYYGAEIRKAPFDDRTLREINGWVKDRTDGMIPEILPDIPEIAIMYLVNAAALEAEWEKKYQSEDISEADFTSSSGEKRNVEMMHSKEKTYLVDDHAIGLRKAYENGLYVFAALMPDEGVSLEEYAASLDGEKLIGIVTDTQKGDVRAAIPKFEAEHDTDMATLLAEAGMPLAFTTAADFSGLGHSSEPIWISRILHRTRLELNEKGVKAAAATAVEMVTSSANLPTKTVYVHLDRPFIYMIWDTRNNIPIFIGCVNDISQ